MKFRVFIFCPMCGQLLNYSNNNIDIYHHKDFGVICSKKCFKIAEEKYAKIILCKEE